MFEREALWAWLGLALVIGMLFDGFFAWRDRGRGLFFAAGLAYLLIGHWVIDLSVILAERIAMWPTVPHRCALLRSASSSANAFLEAGPGSFTLTSS